MGEANFRSMLQILVSWCKSCWGTKASVNIEGRPQLPLLFKVSACLFGAPLPPQSMAHRPFLSTGGGVLIGSAAGFAGGRGRSGRAVAQCDRKGQQSLLLRCFLVLSLK